LTFTVLVIGYGYIGARHADILASMSQVDEVYVLSSQEYTPYKTIRKVSDLEIETENLMLLTGRMKNGNSVHIILNYFTRKAVRQIIIDGKDISIQDDLITKTATFHEDGEASEYIWPDLTGNASYEAEHEALLSGNVSIACTYEEGLETMCLIDTIREWQNK
jgi:hypothetical protein